MLLYDKTPAENWRGGCRQSVLPANQSGPDGPSNERVFASPWAARGNFLAGNEQPPKHQSHDRQSGCNAALSFYVQPKVPRIYLDFWDRRGKLSIQ